jgi:hypothetical protein
MADIEAEIAALRDDAAEQGRQVARAEHEVAEHRGRLEAIRADLAHEFGVEGVEAARAKAGRVETALRAEVAKMRGALAQAGGQA